MKRLFPWCLAALTGLAGLSTAQAMVFDYEAFGALKEGVYSPYRFDGSDDVVFHDLFEDFGPPDTRDPNDPATAAGVCWGTALRNGMPFGGKSGLGLRDAAGTVTVNGPSEEFGTLVHFNWPINFTAPGDQAGMDVEVSWNLLLEDGEDVIFSQNFAFGLYQWETYNYLGSCERSAPAGTAYTVHGHTFVSDGQAVTDCDDAITFEPLGGGPITFDYEGVTYNVNVLGFYTVSVEENPAYPTSSAAPYLYTCEETLAGGGANPTFWSPETMRNAACVRFSITADLAPDMYVDIKPTSCPNPINAGLNPRSGAVLPAAILGTGEFDVSNVDPATVRLCLGEDCVYPLRWSYGEYAAAPYDGEACQDRESCTTENDEIADLVVHFGYNEVLDTLGLRGRADGEVLCLTLRAEVFNGAVYEPFEGQDVIWINNAAAEE
jgi:hypothetical protein